MVPLWLKLGFTAFVLAWAPLAVAIQGWQNLLWLCDLANFIVLAGLWRESRLLLSSQLVATLIVGIAWMLDLASALATGVHPFAATAYMLDPAVPLALRLPSLFHVVVPAMLLFALARLGHEPRGWRLQTLICWVVLLLSASLTDPARNINWIEAPFGMPQTWLPGWLYVLACMAAYPLILYLPAEALLRRVLPPAPAGKRVHG